MTIIGEKPDKNSIKRTGKSIWIQWETVKDLDKIIKDFSLQALEKGEKPYVTYNDAIKYALNPNYDPVMKNNNNLSEKNGNNKR